MIWTANAFALLGLASLLALIDLLVRRFRFLDETIALVLAFVGVKIVLDDVVHVGDLADAGDHRGFLAVGIGASVVADRLDPPHPAAEAFRRPPRCPPELTGGIEVRLRVPEARRSLDAARERSTRATPAPR